MYAAPSPQPPHQRPDASNGRPNQPNSAPHASPSIPAYSQMASSKKWSTGLCHCFDDPANCLITCICPCITFGQIADIVNRSTPPCAVSSVLYGLLVGLTGFACLYSCVYRSRLRAQYDLDEDPCADCLVHFCCETCALCQEYRELRNRGFDVGLGWQGNMERQSQRGTNQAPNVIGSMMR